MSGNTHLAADHRQPLVRNGITEYYKTAVLAYFPDFRFDPSHASLPAYNVHATFIGNRDRKLKLDTWINRPLRTDVRPMWEAMLGTVGKLSTLLAEVQPRYIEHEAWYPELRNWCTVFIEAAPADPTAWHLCQTGQAWWIKTAFPDTALSLENEHAEEISCTSLRAVISKAVYDLHGLIELGQLTGELYVSFESATLSRRRLELSRPSLTLYTCRS